MKEIEVIIRHVKTAEAIIQKQRRSDPIMYQGDMYKVIDQGECIGSGATQVLNSSYGE